MAVVAAAVLVEVAVRAIGGAGLVSLTAAAGSFMVHLLFWTWGYLIIVRGIVEVPSIAQKKNKY